MKTKILFLMILVLLCLHSISAEIDLRITGSIADISSIFYTETDSSSSNAYDGNDVLAPGHFPSGNSSRFYSTVAGNELAIDSWNILNVPRTMNLTFETSPAQTGTLALSWSFSDASYDATLYYCGTDSSCANPTNTINMKTSSSFSASISSLKVYFKLVISAVAAAYCGDGVCNNGETTASCSTDCPSTGGGCTGSCGDTSARCVGEKYSNGCTGGETACTGTKQLDCGLRKCGLSPNSCGSCGTCAGNQLCKGDGVCSEECIIKTCSELNVECGSVDNGCGVLMGCGSCSSGKQCVEGVCQSILLQCTPACFAGYNCVGGVCVQGEKLKKEDIPGNLPITGYSGCERDFICSVWNECNAAYDVSILIAGGKLTGERKRLCADQNKCSPNFEQKEKCEIKEEVEVRKMKWCNQDYTEIVSKKTGKVLARIKVLPNGRAANINFNIEGDGGTCAHCNDKIKNYDEEDVDCGGSSCVACGQGVLKRSFSLVGTIYGFIFPFLMFFIFILMLVYTLRFMIHYHKHNQESLIARRYNQWKKEGYDVSVLESHFKSLHRRL